MTDKRNLGIINDIRSVCTVFRVWYVVDMLSEFPNYIVTFAPISIIPLQMNDIIIIIIFIMIIISNAL